MSREVRYVIDFKRQFIRVQYIEGGRILKTTVLAEVDPRSSSIEIRQPVSNDTKFPWEHDGANSS